jgi:hypothetical protein
MAELKLLYLRLPVHVQGRKQKERTVALSGSVNRK